MNAYDLIYIVIGYFLGSLAWYGFTGTEFGTKFAWIKCEQDRRVTTTVWPIALFIIVFYYVIIKTYFKIKTKSKYLQWINPYLWVDKIINYTTVKTPTSTILKLDVSNIPSHTSEDKFIIFNCNTDRSMYRARGSGYTRYFSEAYQYSMKELRKYLTQEEKGRCVIVPATVVQQFVEHDAVNPDYFDTIKNAQIKFNL